MRTVVVLKYVNNVRKTWERARQPLMIPIKRSSEWMVEVLKTVVLKCVNVKKCQKKCWINYSYFPTLLKNKEMLENIGSHWLLLFLCLTSAQAYPTPIQFSWTLTEFEKGDELVWVLRNLSCLKLRKFSKRERLTTSVWMYFMHEYRWEVSKGHFPELNYWSYFRKCTGLYKLVKI